MDRFDVRRAAAPRVSMCAVRGSGLAARLINELHRAGAAGGYAHGEMSQVYQENANMVGMLDRMGFPRVREYAVFARYTC